MKLSIALAALIAANAAVAAPKANDIEAYRTLVQQDLRLMTVGYRIAVANAPFCRDRAPSAGWVLHDIAQYPDEETAQAAFAFQQPIQIAAVVEGGPAYQAGVKAGDSFVGLDDATLYWPAMPVGKTGYERMSSFKQLVGERWKTDGSLSVKLIRKSETSAKKIVGKIACRSDFWVDGKTKLDAGADGERVRVTAGLMAYTPDEQELAAVVAHELAHNLLQHRARLDKIRKGKTAAILETEIEADRLSVWLMANAGYDPSAAVRFWERYGRKTGLGIFSAGTHLQWKKRVQLLQAEIDLLSQAEKRNGLVTPPLLSGG